MEQNNFETVKKDNFEQTLESLKQLYPNRLALNVDSTAEILGIEKCTIYNAMRRKNSKGFPIKHRKVGQKLRFNIVDIARFLTQ